MWDKLGLARAHAHARTLMLCSKQRQQVCSFKLPLLLDARRQAGLSMRLHALVLERRRSSQDSSSQECSRKPQC